MKYEIQVLATETGYDGFFELKRFRLRHSLYAGGWSPEITRERVERKEASSVLLYDAGLDKLVMIEQFRIGALESGRGAWMLETVGGLIEPGQTPEAVARAATSLPTSVAAALSAPPFRLARRSLSRLDAAARVTPLRSSITWA